MMAVFFFTAHEKGFTFCFMRNPKLAHYILVKTSCVQLESQNVVKERFQQ